MYEPIKKEYEMDLDWIKSSGIPYKLIGKRTAANIRRTTK
jgi:hypothetical protein